MQSSVCLTISDPLQVGLFKALFYAIHDIGLQFCAFQWFPDRAVFRAVNTAASFLVDFSFSPQLLQDAQYLFVGAEGDFFTRIYLPPFYKFLSKLQKSAFCSLNCVPAKLSLDVDQTKFSLPTLRELPKSDRVNEETHTRFDLEECLYREHGVYMPWYYQVQCESLVVSIRRLSSGRTKDIRIRSHSGILRLNCRTSHANIRTDLRPWDIGPPGMEMPRDLDYTYPFNALNSASKLASHMLDDKPDSDVVMGRTVDLYIAEAGLLLVSFELPKLGRVTFFISPLRFDEDAREGDPK